MLEKLMYDLWASRICLFIKGKKHGRMMLDSIDNGQLVYPSVEENGQIRPKKYSELTKAQQLQDDCDFQATNIILHGLTPDVYALVNSQEAAKDIWDRVKMLMKGTELSYQERECILYNLFDKFAHVLVQVNTKFLNALPSEWSKFVTDSKLAKSLYTTNYDQLYAYLVNMNDMLMKGITTTSKGNVAVGSPRVVKCYNCQGEGHMARQCTQPKRARNVAWFKEKLMLAEAQEAGQILDEEQLAFLADPGISEAPVAHQTIPQNLAFQTDDLDAYDSDCDDLSLAKAVLVANLSSCDPEVLSEASYSDSYLNDMINQDVKEMQYSEQTHVDDFKDIHSGSNIISYSLYLQETQDAVILDTNPSAPNDLLMLSLVEQITDHVAHLYKENSTNKMVNESLTAELERYKERIGIFEKRLNVDLNQKEKLIDSQMDDLIRDRNANLAAFQQEINTLKETLSFNVKEKGSLSQMFTVFKTESKEKESHVIAKEHAVIYVIDDEETLILKEESRSKMLDKQNDPISIEKKIKISPIDYSKLNKIKEDFGKCFVTQRELSVEQDFWLKHSSLSETLVTSHIPVRIEAPSKLPKVNTFNAFDKTLLDEITKVQSVFNQMEAVVDQCSIDKNIFEIQIKQFRIDNDQLLNQIMSQEIVHIVANYVDILDVKKSCVNDRRKCLELKIELFKRNDFVEKEAYDKLVKSYSNLEKRCI
uniref:CCHC-type domain-containing protein n=1 Tax=Tanacetum cinerariifolium TaxID=118510 RepID=A0A699GSY1_TANCI|nr:hypothetical protein [Tanacetum cinerariifolium]